MEERGRRRLDPTRVSDQPALRSASGTVWIVAGGLLLIVIALVLASIIVRAGAALPIAVATLILVAALYVALLVIRFAVRPGKVRLRIMAAAMLGMALFSIVGLLASVWAEANGAR